jgi:hypothetical protein
VSVEVQEKPKELPAQPVTLESAAQLLPLVLKPMQQYSKAPLLPATAVLQFNALLPLLGVSLELQEKPYDPDAQPETLASGAQLLVLLVTQQ